MRRRYAWVLALTALLVSCSDDTSSGADPGGDAGDGGDATSDVVLDGVEDGDLTADLGLGDAPGADLGDVGGDGTDATADDASDALADGDDLGGDAPSDLSAEPDPDASDAGVGSLPLAGFGEISGDCDFLDDTEWGAPNSSFVFVNVIDFGDDPYDEADYALLTDGGRELIDDGNLNASSLISEVFSYEVLARCELAEMLASEAEITYADPDGPKTDFLALIDDRQIGVSVTRAHPMDNPFDATRAQELLEGKLQGVLDSTANVTGDDVWARQILHVIAADPVRVDALLTAYPLISSELRSSTIVVITRGDGDDAPLW